MIMRWLSDVPSKIVKLVEVRAVSAGRCPVGCPYVSTKSARLLPRISGARPRLLQLASLSRRLAPVPNIVADWADTSSSLPAQVVELSVPGTRRSHALVRLWSVPTSDEVFAAPAGRRSQARARIGPDARHQ
jgi:hypothetical protein